MVYGVKTIKYVHCAFDDCTGTLTRQLGYHVDRLVGDLQPGWDEQSAETPHVAEMICGLRCFFLWGTGSVTGPLKSPPDDHSCRLRGHCTYLQEGLTACSRSRSEDTKQGFFQQKAGPQPSGVSCPARCQVTSLGLPIESHSQASRGTRARFVRCSARALPSRG